MHTSFISRMFPLLSFLFCPLMLSLDGGGDAGGGGGGGGDAGAGGGQGGGDAGAAAAAAAAVAAGGQAGPLLDAQGNFTKGWAKQLGAPETLEAKFTSPKALVGSYANLEKMIAAKGIIKPGADATPEQVDAYYAALGRPAKPEEYALAKPEKITIDGKEVAVPAELWNKDDAAAAQTLFHKIGLTKEQAAALTQFDVARGLKGMGAIEAASQKAQDDGIAALKGEWKGEYDTNLKAAKDAAAKVGLTPEVLNVNPAIANSPIFIKAMAAVAKMVLEAPAAGLRGGGAGAGGSPAAEIAAIYADKNHAWHPANANKDPGAHKAAVARMAELYRLKNGEAA